MDMKKYFEISIFELLKKESLDQITVTDLIREVGSCKGTFYKYYMDKYDLCYKCLSANIYSKISFDVKEWEPFIEEFIKLMDHNSKILINAFAPKELNSPREYNNRLLSGAIATVLEKKGLDTSERLLAFTIRATGVFITEIIYEWFVLGKRETCEQVLEQIRAVFPQSIYREMYTVKEEVE